MKYIVMAAVLLPAIYTLSYSKYAWSKKNKKAAVGAIVLALASVVLPAVMLFVR